MQGSMADLVAGEGASAALAASDKFGNVFSLNTFLQVRRLELVKVLMFRPNKLPCTDLVSC